MSVSRETEARLGAFAALIEKWTQKINLIAPSTRDQLWERHIQDSAQLFNLRENASKWADLGSGAGLPGLVVAIIASDKAPNMRVTLVESDKRKAAFCRAAIRELGLSATVISERLEAAKPQVAEVVSARALAPLPILLGYAERHLAPGGIALFLKGAEHKAEINDALASWRFSVEKVPSATNPRGVILKVGDIKRA